MRKLMIAVVAIILVISAILAVGCVPQAPPIVPPIPPPIDDIVPPEDIPPYTPNEKVYKVDMSDKYKIYIDTQDMISKMSDISYCSQQEYFDTSFSIRSVEDTFDIDNVILDVGFGTVSTQPLPNYQVLEANNAKSTSDIHELYNIDDFSVENYGFAAGYLHEIYAIKEYRFRTDIKFPPELFVEGTGRIQLGFGYFGIVFRIKMDYTRTGDTVKLLGGATIYAYKIIEDK